MKLDGQLKETAYLSPAADDRENNLKATANILGRLKNENYKKIGNNFLWKNNDKSIVKDFLAEFRVYKKDPFGITTRMPIEFVKKYVNDRDTKWDIALYSGKGSEYKIGSVAVKKEERVVVKLKFGECPGEEVRKGGIGGGGVGRGKGR